MSRVIDTRIGAAPDTTSADTDDRAVTPCQRVDPEIFFPETAEDTATAKRTCRRCDIRDACLRGALQRREPWGVWGGELFSAGVVVRTETRRPGEAAA